MRKLQMTVLTAAIALAVGLASDARSARSVNRTSVANVPAQAKATVKMGNFQFTPKLLTVTPGTTVEWVNEGGRHLVVADDASFKSDVLKQGDKFEHKFEKAGTFGYYCEFHGEKGGKDMAGKIVVRGAAKK